MTNSLESLIAFLEETTDPRVAFFSYTSDESGESGAISANKEGLRLYAVELLKKSLEMERMSAQRSLLLCPKEWMVSETGYNLISCVRPLFGSRDKILSVFGQNSYEKNDPRFKL